jgi:hypothetical protein
MTIKTYFYENFKIACDAVISDRNYFVAFFGAGETFNNMHTHLYVEIQGTYSGKELSIARAGLRQQIIDEGIDIIDTILESDHSFTYYVLTKSTEEKRIMLKLS